MKINKTSPHLLVIDDDTRIRVLLQKFLIEQGYFVSIAKDSFDAENLLKEVKVDLIITDLMMPGKSGIDFTKRLRTELNFSIPVIMLTAMGEVEDKINGLEIGADDYVVKPFEPKELALRVANILRRYMKNKSLFYFSHFVYNLNTQILTRNNEPIFLTQSDQLLLNYFIKNHDKVITREELAKELNINERSVDVQVVRLRSKIEDNPSRPLFLQTIRSQGYTLRT